MPGGRPKGSRNKSTLERESKSGKRGGGSVAQAEKQIEVISENLQEMKIYEAMIDGKSLKQIAGELSVSESTVVDKLRKVSTWTSQALDFKRNNWLMFTLERTEAAMSVVMAQIRKYQGNPNADIDFRIFDTLRQIIKTQEEAIGMVTGRKDLPGGNVQNNTFFAPTIVGGGKLHNIATAREQNIIAGEVMPVLEEHAGLQDELYSQLTMDDNYESEFGSDNSRVFAEEQ